MSLYIGDSGLKNILKWDSFEEVHWKFPHLFGKFKLVSPKTSELRNWVNLILFIFQSFEKFFGRQTWLFHQPLNENLFLENERDYCFTKILWDVLCLVSLKISRFWNHFSFLDNFWRGKNRDRFTLFEVLAF